MTTILLLLVVLWLLGIFSPVALLYRPLGHLNGHPVSLWDILLFLLIIWLIGILPKPFRQIVTIFLILWLLSLLGIFVISGLSNLLLPLLIIGLALYLFGVI